MTGVQTCALPIWWGREATGLAGWVALLWGVHPLLTQSVTYLSQRTEALMALFYLLTLYGFVRGLHARPRLWHCLAVVACLLGALCKEIIVTAPVAVLLCDLALLGGGPRAALRRHRFLYLGLALSWLLTAALMLDVRSRGVGLGLGVSSFH